jgi:hypothetical protein
MVDIDCEIASQAFFECKLLHSILILGCIRILKSPCFAQCVSLCEVLVEHPSEVKLIEQYAFANCGSLTSIWIPASVATIGDSCFADCRRLSAADFRPGPALSGIAKQVFDWCLSLQSICIRCQLKRFA